MSVSLKSDVAGEVRTVEIRNDKDKQVTIRLIANTAGRSVSESSNKYQWVRGSSLEWDITVKSHEVSRLSYTLRKKDK